MFEKLFGKKRAVAANVPAPLVPSPGISKIDAGANNLKSLDGFPWAGQPDNIACNFALGDLNINLPAMLTIDGRIHAETLVAACGAIAGFAAQRTTLIQMHEHNDQVGLDKLIVVESSSGQKYIFGDAINAALFLNSTNMPNLNLWSIARGGAIAAGLDPAHLPPLEEMFKYVSEVLGSENEGFPSQSENQPALPARELLLPARELLKRVWPMALKCFNGELSGSVRKQGVTIVSMRWRPVIAAIAANKIIRDVQSVLPPARALKILMETAIYTSKLDPTDFEAST